MSNHSEAQPAQPRPAAARAFLLAPGIAALTGALVAVSMVFLDPAPMRGSLGFLLLFGFMFLSVAFALGGYITAALIGVPVYLALPERARSCFAVVVPLAGIIAAAPWLLLAAPWRHGSADLTILAVPFALGVVAGIAFLFLRRPSEIDAGPAGGDRGPLDF